jgi:hypothetical protein
VEQQQYYEVVDACFTDPEKRYWKQQEIIAVFKEFGVKMTIPKLNSIIFSMNHDCELALFAPIGSLPKRGFGYGDKNYSIAKKRESIAQYNKLAQRLLNAPPDDPIAVLPWAIRGFIRYTTNNDPEKEGFHIMSYRQLASHGLLYEIALGKILLAMLDKKAAVITIRSHTCDAEINHIIYPYSFTEGLVLIAYSENYREIMPFYLEEIVEVHDYDQQQGDVQAPPASKGFIEDKRKLIRSRGDQSVAVSFPPQMKGYLARYRGPKAKPNYTIIQDDETVFRIDWSALNPRDEPLLVYHGYGLELVEPKPKGRRKRRV